MPDPALPHIRLLSICQSKYCTLTFIFYGFGSLGVSFFKTMHIEEKGLKKL